VALKADLLAAGCSMAHIFLEVLVDAREL